MQTVNEDYCQLAAHCTREGRIIALFHLFAHADQDAYLLFMRRDMLAIAERALKKYALFYQVNLADVSDQWACYGSSDKNISDEMNTADKSCIKALRFDDTRQLLLYARNAQPTTISAQPHTAWVDHNIKIGLATIYPQTSRMFLPHDINLQHLGAIHFDKGCYTGQEIIARMHYRGKLKKRLYPAQMTCTNETPTVGENIYCRPKNSLSAAKETGNIIDMIAVSPNQYRLLILIEEKEAHNNHLFLKNNSTNYNYFVLGDLVDKETENS